MRACSSRWASQVLSLRNKQPDSGVLFQALQVTNLKTYKSRAVTVCVCVCVYMCVPLYVYEVGQGRVGDLLREKMEMCRAKQRPEGDQKSGERRAGASGACCPLPPGPGPLKAQHLHSFLWVLSGCILLFCLSLFE